MIWLAIIGIITFCLIGTFMVAAEDMVSYYWNTWRGKRADKKWIKKHKREDA